MRPRGRAAAGRGGGSLAAHSSGSAAVSEGPLSCRRSEALATSQLRKVPEAPTGRRVAGVRAAPKFWGVVSAQGK